MRGGSFSDLSLSFRDPVSDLLHQLEWSDAEVLFGIGAVLVACFGLDISLLGFKILPKLS